MLVSVATVLARGKRARTLVPSFQVSNLEMIETVIESLVLHKKSAIISLHTAKKTSPSLEWLYLCAKELIERQSIDIALQVIISPTKQMVERVLELGIHSIQLEFEASLPLKDIAMMTSLVTQRARPLHIEVNCVLSRLMSETNLIQFTKETSIDSITLPLTVTESGREVLLTRTIADVSKKLPIPLLAHNEYLPESLIKQLKKTGIE